MTKWVLEFLKDHPAILEGFLRFLLNHPQTLDKLLGIVIKKLDA